jgi:signal transduction histidine kinase
LDDSEGGKPIAMADLRSDLESIKAASLRAAQTRSELVPEPVVRVLHETVIEQTLLHQRSVQERAATAQRLEALGILAGSVAHDLNNALAPWAMQSEMILRELDALDSSQSPRLSSMRSEAQNIQKSSLQAAQIVKDLLTLGRQGKGARELIDLTVMVKWCVDSERVRRPLDPERQIRVSTSWAGAPLMVLAVQAQIARAVSNLVRNAMEACEGEGEIAVSTSMARVTEPLAAYEVVEPGTYGVISVADSGIGMSAQRLSRIFEPYYSGKRMGDASGTGLGLAIVHGVVKEHEGYVDVASSVDQGTTFRLFLPLVIG